MFLKRWFGSQKSRMGEQINRYLQYLVEASRSFKAGIAAYLCGDEDGFNRCIGELIRIEKEADILLKMINNHIYTHMLYPNIQKDICKLLNILDDIIDAAKQVTIQISIEKPEIPGPMKRAFSRLTENTCMAVQEVASATACFFSNAALVEDHVNKVIRYENEADKLEQLIKRKAHSFDSIETLSHKDHLCYFAGKITMPSDKAYRVAKELLIYSMNKDSYADHFV